MPAAAPELVARELGLDAASLAAAADPPAASGDLRAEIDGFTTLEACVAARAGLDPLLGDALDAVGYDTFLRDACRVLSAAKTKDPSGCSGIVASGLRDRCTFLVALVAGDANKCPFIAPARPTLGRSPACLAALARDPRPCGAELTARATCEAVARGDKAPCAHALGAGETARCQRTLTRLLPLLPQKGPKEPRPPTGRLTASARGGEADAGAADLVAEASLGLVLVTTPGGTRAEIGRERPHEIGGTFLQPGVRGTLGLVPGANAPLAYIALEIDLPGIGRASCPSATCTVQGRASTGEGRGSAVDVEVNATLTQGSRVYDARLVLASYVRDVISGRDLIPQ